MPLLSNLLKRFSCCKMSINIKRQRTATTPPSPRKRRRIANNGCEFNKLECLTTYVDHLFKEHKKKHYLSACDNSAAAELQSFYKEHHGRLTMTSYEPRGALGTCHHSQTASATTLPCLAHSASVTAGNCDDRHANGTARNSVLRILFPRTASTTTSTSTSTTCIANSNKSSNAVVPSVHYNTTCENLLNIPDIWECEILSFFDMTQLARNRRVSKWFESFWQTFLGKRTVRVPQDLPSIRKALRVGELLNKQLMFTKEHPLRMVLDKGTHVIDEYNLRKLDSATRQIDVNFSVDIVGTGIGGTQCGILPQLGDDQHHEHTVVNGGFKINGLKNDHVTFTNLTVLGDCDDEDDEKAYSGCHGVCGKSGASFALNNVQVLKCYVGIIATDTNATLHNVGVSQCMEEGLLCGHNGAINISGGLSHVTYCGLDMGSDVKLCYKTSTLNIVHPLSKDSIAGNSWWDCDEGYGHWDGEGRVAIVDDSGKSLKVVYDGENVDFVDVDVGAPEIWTMVDLD